MKIKIKFYDNKISKTVYKTKFTKWEKKSFYDDNLKQLTRMILRFFKTEFVINSNKETELIKSISGTIQSFESKRTKKCDNYFEIYLKIRKKWICVYSKVYKDREDCECWGNLIKDFYKKYGIKIPAVLKQ